MSKSAYKAEYNDETLSERLARKAKNSPFMIMGLAGLVAVTAMGAYKFKTRGAIKPDVYVMQMRVAAQGTVVGALSVGLAYSLTQKYLLHAAAPMIDDNNNNDNNKH